MALFIVIIILSILFQIMSAFLAMKLVKVTRHTTAWLLISTGIALMAIRRIDSFVGIVSNGHAKTPDLMFETIGLLTSVLMFTGIYLIRPLFLTFIQSEEKLHVMNNRLSSLANEQEQLISELREAAANIKTLKGMLPICASCKKVRDDNGYWNQIESYVRKHSDAEFSHGICPDCMQRLYPDYCADRDKKQTTH